MSGDLAQLGPHLPPSQTWGAPGFLGSVKLRLAQGRQPESSRSPLGLPGSAGYLWCLLTAGDEIWEAGEGGEEGGEDWHNVGQ